MTGYDVIYKHYEDCFSKHGDSHKGVDWPNKEHADVRYKIMLELAEKNMPCSLLDFGCGLSHLYEFMRGKKEYEGIKYSGLDISEKFIEASKAKYPEVEYFAQDNLKEPLNKHFDYIIMNGVFTEKREMSHQSMYDFFTALILKVFSSADKGIAFNVMSKYVDWERDDLFHLPIDDLGWFLHKNKMRHFIIRNDYGLYEYTVYVYKEPHA